MEKKIKLEDPEHIVSRIEPFFTRELCLPENTGIIVGVSGGPDSVALLHLLYSLAHPLKLHAVYIDHQLRPDEVPDEIAMLQKRCSLLNIPFYTERIQVHTHSRSTGQSIEEAARNLRYEALERIRIRQKAEFIAVAHTADDQVEEFLLRLSRGPSPAGLSGMKRRRGRIIRPLLEFPKQQLLNFLQINNISYCVDSTNLDRRYLRNQVRLEVLPFLKRELSSSIEKKILQAMNILATEEDFMADICDHEYEKCITSSESTSVEPTIPGLLLDTDKFRTLHPALQHRILEKCCININSKAAYEVIIALADKISTGNLPREHHLPGGGRIAISGQALLFCRPELTSKRSGIADSEVVCLKITEPGGIDLHGTHIRIVLSEMDAKTLDIAESSPNAHFIDFDRITFPLMLRSSRPGERFTPFNRSGSKKVARFFNEKKIPARERNSWPVLLTEDEGELIAIPGLEIENSYKISETTKKVLKIERLYR